MDKLVVDDLLFQQLSTMGHSVELCSTSGVPVGRFVPFFVPPPEDNCPYSPEELERMRNEKGGAPLEELWKKLGVR